MNGWALATTAFLASGVEMVEALTIVLAVAVTHGYRAALGAAVLAIAVLSAIVGIGGAALLALFHIPIVRIALGAFLIYYGYKWLRKAILRYAGRMKMRDEAAAYERGVTRLREESPREGFLTAFQGVFVEGLEVAIIVVGVGGASTLALQWAALGAAGALVLVVALGVALHRPLSQVPENTLKFAVGIALVTLGIYWLGEGLGFQWPLADAALAYIGIIVLGISALLVRVLQQNVRQNV